MTSPATSPQPRPERAAPAPPGITVDDLRAVARTALADVLAGSRTVALVNFPNHGNPGDPAIWLGSRRLLRDLGVRVGYSSAWWDLDPAALRDAVGDAPVLLNGGGNLGDLYAGQQGTRTTVLRTLRDNPVVQLPQSIHFRDPANEEAMGELLRSHPDARLMVREHRSAAIARDRWGITPVLSPDHALGLGRLARTAEPRIPILWLTRVPGDPEFVDHGGPAEDDPQVRRVEWLHGVAEDQATWDAVGRAALALNVAVHARWDAGRPWSRPMHAAAALTYEPLAWRWVRRGLDLLGSAEVVVTDKLHGHLLCALLGIPHVVLDNSYGKVSGTLDAWTQHLPGVHRAADGESALATARSLLGAGR